MDQRFKMFTMFQSMSIQSSMKVKNSVGRFVGPRSFSKQLPGFDAVGFKSSL